MSKINMKISEQNITDRKSEVKYRLLHESMMDAFVRVDMAGRILESNSAYQAMLGYTAEDLLELNYTDLTPEKWHPSEARIIEEQVLRQGYSDVYEKEYRRKDGTVFPVEVRTFLLRDDAGQPVTMWAIVRNITARKQLEEAISRVSSEWQTTFDSASDLVMLMDKDFRITRLNRAAMSFLGVPYDQVLGKHCYELMHGTDVPPPECPYVKMKMSMSHEKAELFLPERNIWASISVDPVFDQTGELSSVVHIVRDITELKQLEDQLIHRNQELEESLARVKKLEGIISICMYCKKIRNEEHAWDQLESYISQHTDARFSHGICPECVAKQPWKKPEP